MSLAAMDWVFRHSPAEGGARLVLLALADTAHDDGSETYPSVDTLATKARLSRRAVQYALRKLEADGCVERDGFSRHGTTIYRILIGGGANIAPVQPEVGGGRNMDPNGAQPTAPEPKEQSVEPLPLSENSLEVGPEPTSNGHLEAQWVAHEGAREGPAEIGEVVEMAPPLRFNGRPVSRSLASDALAALAYFNAQTGQALKPTTASGKPTEGLSRILGAMTEHPEVRTIYRRMIDHTLASRWWGDDEPHPGVIFGKRVAEQSIQRAHAPRPMPSLRGLTPSGRAIAKLLAADGG